MALADLNCRNAKRNGRIQKLTDSGGLQLWVPASGTRLWRLAYRFKGKQKLLAVGFIQLSRYQQPEKPAMQQSAYWPPASTPPQIKSNG